MSLWPSERAEVRRSRYKVAVNAEEDRRRREDNMAESRHGESLLKKRHDGVKQMGHSSTLQQKLEGLPAMVHVVPPVMYM